MKNKSNRIAILIILAIFLVAFAPINDAQAVYAASKLKKPSITSIKANSTTTITIKWKKVNDAKGYQIRYSSKPSMKNAKKLTASSKIKKIKGLKAGKKYYVQVRAFKKNGSRKVYGKWSKPKSVTTKYSIKYVLNKGVQAPNQRTCYSKATTTFKLKSPTRSGYTFNGWYTSPSFKTKVTSIKKGTTGNKKYYAKWTKKKSPNTSGPLNVELCNDKNISITLASIKNGHLEIKVDNNSKENLNVGLSYLSFNGCYFYDEVIVESTYAGKTKTIMIDESNLNGYCFTGGQLKGRFYYYNDDISEKGLTFNKNIVSNLPNNNSKPKKITKTLLCEDSNIALYKVAYEKNELKFCIVNKSNTDYTFGFSYVDFGGNTYYDDIYVTGIYAGCEKVYILDESNLNSFTYSSGGVTGRAYYHNEDGDEWVLNF